MGKMKKIEYKDKVKPSVFPMIFFSIAVIFTIAAIIFSIWDVTESEKLLNTNIIYFVCYIILLIVFSFEWAKRKKKYRMAVAENNAYIKYGKKYKGRIINTEISTHTNFSRYRKDVTVYEYYAVVEFTDDNGEEITFKTPQLTGNPEYLDTKEVTVYSFNDIHYATDFGQIEKRKMQIEDRFWWLDRNRY
jgi:hypothetical protein